MAEQNNNQSVFQKVLDAVSNNRHKTPQTKVQGQPPGLATPAQGMFGSLEDFQQQYLDWQYNKVAHDLYSRTIYFDTDRINAYHDFRAMDHSPEIAAALTIMTDECLAGDTIIPLLDATKESIESLYERDAQDFYVYSYNVEKQKIEPGLCQRVAYKGEQEVFRVTFENGSYIDATSNHQWLMLNSSEYKITEDLVAGDSVQPFYFNDSDSSDRVTQVISIESIGVQKTYDLVNVGEHHNFACLTSNGDGVFTHNCLTRNERGTILEVYSGNDRIKRVLEDLFYNRLNIEYNLNLWIRDLLKYGDYFVHLHVHKDEGIYDFMSLPQEEIHREEGYDGSVSSVRFRWETTSDYFESWQIAHFRLLEDTRRLPYGRCLKHDTHIETVDGYKFIKDIRPGDKVFSFDYDNQTKIVTNVLDTICSGEKEIIKIRTKNNEIEASKEHRFLVSENSVFCYKSVEELKLGDLLVIDSGKESQKSDNFILNPIVSLEKNGTAEVYDIHVENEYHNFYANGIVVHNSVLDPARKLWKQLQLAEDSMLVYRITRAPERRIFYVEVGNLEDADVKTYMQRIQKQLKKQPVVNQNNGNMGFRYDPMNITEDYFIPVRGDKSSKIDTLPGACLALDTKIELLDGRSLELNNIISEFKEGKQLWTYSVNPNTGAILPGKITWAGVTRKNAEVLRLTFDNGKSVTVTPDHKFPTRFSGIQEAQNLKIGDSMWSYKTSNQEASNKVWDHEKSDWVSTENFLENYLSQLELQEEERVNEKVFFNHKIVAVEWLEEKQDTGTITIDGQHEIHDFHNFALAVGVFTQNSNLGDIMDIEYLQNKLFASLKVPKTYLNYAENLPGGPTLSQADLRFARTINRIQEQVLMELRRIAKIHLAFVGFESEINNFDLKLTNPSTQQELLKLETMKARLEVFKEFVSQDVYSPASYTWGMKYILGFSDKDIKKMLRQKKVERKLFTEIEIAPQTYKKIGLFKDLDDKFEIPGAAEALQNAENEELFGNDEGGGFGGGGGGGFGGGGDATGGSALGGLDLGGGGADDAGGGLPAGVPEPAPGGDELSEIRRKLYERQDSYIDGAIDELLNELEDSSNPIKEEESEEENLLIKSSHEVVNATERMLEEIKRSLEDSEKEISNVVIQRGVLKEMTDENPLVISNNELVEKAKNLLSEIEEQFIEGNTEIDIIEDYTDEDV